MGAVLLGRWWAALACTVVVGCSACDGTSGRARDAGLGGTGDAAAGGTGGLSGVGNDGARTGTGGGTRSWHPSPAHWETPVWNPADCNFLQAKNASEALPSTPWIDCNSGIAGCLVLDTSAVPGEGNVPGSKLGHLMEVAKVNGKVHFSLPLLFGAKDNVSAVYDVDGPLAAWRAPDMLTGCVIGDARFGEASGASVRVHYDTVPKGGRRSRVVYGTISQMLSSAAQYVDMSEASTGSTISSVHQVQFSSDLMVMDMIAPNVLYVWDYAGTPQLVPQPSDVSEDHSPVVLGKEVLFTREFKGLAVRHADGSVEMLHTKPGVWAAVFLTDYEDFAWQELGQTGVLELWASPFATTAPAFKPKKVRTVEGISNNLVSSGFGEGWWVYRKSLDALRAVRVSDGQWVDAPAPEGMGWQRVIDVVDGEIWALVRSLSGAETVTTSLARVPIGALGAPMP